MSLVRGLCQVNDSEHGVFPSLVAVGVMLRVNDYGKPWRKVSESAFIMIACSAELLLQQETA